MSKEAKSVLEMDRLLNARVRVKFAGGREVLGILKGHDAVSNLVLVETEEYLRDPDDPYKLLKQTRKLGLVVARGTATMDSHGLSWRSIMDRQRHPPATFHSQREERQWFYSQRPPFALTNSPNIYQNAPGGFYGHLASPMSSMPPLPPYGYPNPFIWHYQTLPPPPPTARSAGLAPTPHSTPSVIFQEKTVRTFHPSYRNCMAHGGPSASKKQKQRLTNFARSKGLRSSVHCDVCEKDFENHQKLSDHIDEEHVPCLEPNCTYSAPPSLLNIHRLAHMKDKNGVPLLNSDEVIRSWIESRRRNYPTQKRIMMKKEAAKHPNKPNSTDIGEPLNVLEKMLRETSIPSFGRSNVDPPPESAFLPKLSRMVLAMPTTLEPISNHTRSAKRLKFKNGLYAYGPSYVAEPFPICKHFINGRNCRFGAKCLLSHDSEGYKRWQRAQYMIDALEVPKRPPLLHQLLWSDIQNYETKLLNCFRFFVESNFFEVDTRSNCEHKGD